MNQTAPTPTPESARLLKRLVDRSKRTSGIQLPIGFVRTDDPASPPPLTKMLRGGRGGEVRLKLYLSMTLVASRPPHDIRSIPARAWAEALALPEPSRLGARRIADAVQWLNDAQMIAAVRRQGAAPSITLLDPLDRGKRYTRPIGRYVSVPLGLWREQWITILSGRAVALLIVLLDLQGGTKSAAKAPSLATGQRQRYCFSGDTWTRATSELVRNDLLTVRRAPHGRDFDWRRIRNTYWVNKELLDMPIDRSPDVASPHR